MTAHFACVVLTMGRRPDDLRRGVESLLEQRDVAVDVVVVGNGCDPGDVAPGVRTVALPENIGATAGRNAGVPHVEGALLLFLDDDAALPSDDTLARMGRLFEDPTIGVVQPRVVDPQGNPTARHHVPRLRVGDPQEPSDVTTFWEGGVAIRRDVFEQVGGFWNELWYAHEGIDLAWRVMDAGFRIRYAGDIVANHPAPKDPPHGEYHYLMSRNRVWIARRYLPWVLAVIHVAVWFLVSLLRARNLRTAQQVVSGFVDGIRKPARSRRPLRWRTIWRMTAIGRPPVI